MNSSDGRTAEASSRTARCPPPQHCNCVRDTCLPSVVVRNTYPQAGKPGPRAVRAIACSAAARRTRGLRALLAAVGEGIIRRPYTGAIALEVTCFPSPENGRGV